MFPLLEHILSFWSYGTLFPSFVSIKTFCLSSFFSNLFKFPGQLRNATAIWGYILVVLRKHFLSQANLRTMSSIKAPRYTPYLKFAMSFGMEI